MSRNNRTDEAVEVGELPLVSLGQGDYRIDLHDGDIQSPRAYLVPVVLAVLAALIGGALLSRSLHADARADDTPQRTHFDQGHGPTPAGGNAG